MLRQHAETLEQTGEYSAVGIGYLNYSSPPFSAAVNDLVLAGAREIVVVPYFLVAGRFVVHDLPPHIEEACRRHPAVRIKLAQPILAAEELVGAILQSVALAKPLREAARTPMVAVEDCEFRNDCPLFSTPACPRQGEPL